MNPPDLSTPAALIVEDVLLNRVVLAVALRRLGYRVTQAVEGEEALRRLDEAKFDVVFLDWDLPGLNGDEVARRIVARPHAPPIIAITADDSAEMRDRGRRAGVTAHLGKAFTPDALAALVTKVVGPPVSADLAPPPGETAAHKLLKNNSTTHLAAERAKLAHALAGADPDGARRALHNIVSLAGMVGACEVHAAARTLQESLRLGHTVETSLAALDARLATHRTPGACPGADTP